MGMTLTMVEAKQLGRTLYMGSMAARDVVRLGRVAEWSEAGGGYQRAPSRARVSKLAQFLTRDRSPLLPMSVLLSHRGEPLQKRKVADDVSEIDVPDGHVLWIVDGQHRVAGLQRAIEKEGREEFGDFQLPVVLVEFEDEVQEANQFRIINERMKKIDTMLARRLLEIHQQSMEDLDPDATPARDEFWQIASVRILKTIRSAPGSPWSGRLQGPNETRLPGHVARELSFSTSLKPLVRNDLLLETGVEGMAAYLLDYWAAWRQLVPHAFVEPDHYVLQKTPGIFALHLVARHVLEQAMTALNRVPTADEVAATLKHAGVATEVQFWKAGNPEGAAMAGSMAGFKLLADAITESLP